jgi:hypothetical protein
MSSASESPDRLSIDKLREIAKWHRYLVWIVFLQIIGTLAQVIISIAIRSARDVPSTVASLGILAPTVFLLATAVVSIYGVYKLGSTLSKMMGIVYAILMFFPFVSLIVLLYLSAVANRVLQANGIEVGIMGASRESVDRIEITAVGSDGSQGITS